jgi:hypothetical protein
LFPHRLAPLSTYILLLNINFSSLGAIRFLAACK